MARRASFTPKKTKSGWMISIPPAYTETGKRERYFYKTRKAADEATDSTKKSIEEHGRQSKAISPSLAEQAVAAVAMLKPYGIGLLAAVERVVKEEAAKSGSVTVDASTAQFLIAKEAVSLKEQKSFGYACRDLKADFTGRMLADITTDEVRAHIESRTNGITSYNGRRKNLVTFWRWAADDTEGRSWCDRRTVSRVKKKDLVSETVIEVLSPDEATKLMRACEVHAPDCVPAFALSLFAGIRRGNDGEISKLEVAHIKKDGIEIPATVAKGGTRRFINMTPQIRAWLKAYPITGRHEVVPPNWKRKEQYVRRMAGWRVWSDLADPAAAPETLPKWPQNCIRHTAATVVVNSDKDLKILIFEHGHSDGVDVLRKHYVGKLSKVEAAIVERLRPKKA